MSTPSRFLGIGVALGLAAGLLVGVGLTGPGQAAAATPSTVPSVSAGGAVPVLPSVGTTTITRGGTTVAQAGTAVAYPYFAGSPGVAPDHTVVVTGVGQADVQSDGSNQAAALADAKAQLDVIAADTRLTISGVLSVSASASPGYGVMPMTGAGTPTCVAPVPVPGNGTTTLPQPVCPPTYQQTLSASVTVEYSVH